MNGIEQSKPSINVFYSSKLAHSVTFEQVLYGIEEEQIPYLLKQAKSDKALELSFMAARKSRLGVGIGIGSDHFIVLHETKLEKDKPLLQIHLNESYDKERAIGANAARIVKGMPFKELIKVVEEDVKPDSVIDKEKIAQIVKSILSNSEQ